MTFQFTIDRRTFKASTLTDKNATSNYDTQLTVSENKQPVAGCMVKNSDSKDTVLNAAKKCAKMYITTNFFN